MAVDPFLKAAIDLVIPVPLSELEHKTKSVLLILDFGKVNS